MVGTASGRTLSGILCMVATRLGTTYSMTSFPCSSWAFRSHGMNM
ncbi:hypothetical protein [Streptomyces xiaopingdaonensis]